MIETNTKPAWIIEAEKHIGLKEIKGPDHAPKIIQWLIKLKAWWKDDETPWCGVFVAACLKETGIAIPKHWYRAKAYLDWGREIRVPCYGCIAIFERQGGGHVGFVVGIDQFDRLLVLGGNQGNQVSVAPFDLHRATGYRMPANTLEFHPLPQLNTYVASSRNEA
jgi:uncharacterized protein (TIGR02594 family)